MQQSGLLWQLFLESDSGLLLEMLGGELGLQQVQLQRCRWRLAKASLAGQTAEVMAQSARLGRPLVLGSRATLVPVLALEPLGLFVVLS